MSAEAQICARESAKYKSSDDDDDKGFNVKRSSNSEGSRKRRVVLSYSDDEDEYENAISLGSPDPPKKSTQCSKVSSNTSASEYNISLEEKENKPKVKEEKEGDVKANQHLEEKVSDGKKAESPPQKKKAESPISEKTQCHVPETDASKKNTMANEVPKRRKVVKTQVDEKGREGISTRLQLSQLQFYSVEWPYFTIVFFPFVCVFVLLLKLIT